MQAIRFKGGQGNYGALTNFRENPIYIPEEDITYRNTEAAYQAFKTLNLNIRKDFARMPAGLSKSEGKKLKIRHDWEDVKFERMVIINYIKYSQNEYLKELLLSTGTALIIEDTTAWHDNEWGCCNCPQCASEVSKNKLGLALMIVRSKLREEESIPVDISFKQGGEFRIDLNGLINTKGIITDNKYREALQIAYRYAL